MIWTYAAMLVPFSLAAVLYTFTPPIQWHKEPLGRAVVILLWTLTILLGNTVIRRLTDGSNFQDVVQPVIQTGGLISGWYLLFALLHTQARGRRIRRERAACEQREREARQRASVPGVDG